MGTFRHYVLMERGLKAGPNMTGFVRALASYCIYVCFKSHFLLMIIIILFLQC
jgi:hypothetical protein